MCSYMFFPPVSNAIQTMGALSELISANALWDSVVQDTITLLEKEDERLVGVAMAAKDTRLTN